MTNTTNFSIGYAITSSGEQMGTCTLEELFEKVASLSETDLSRETSRLRKLMTLDKSVYKTVKTRLPYVVGSVFKHGIRKKEHLLAAHYFVLDVDHIPIHESRVPESIRSHSAVALAFVSPGGEGLKIFCRLSTPCSDPDLFSAAYKRFASRFAEETELTGKMDLRTSDVTRACFLAHDPHAYFNPLALTVDWAVTTEVFESGPVNTDEEGQPGESGGINEEAYKAVLKAINPQAPVRRVREVFLPEPLLQFQNSIEGICREVNLEIVSVQPIQYGLKIVAKHGYRIAEVNVFYGKRGFSVVKSPKTGTDRVLTDLLHDSLFAYLFPPVQAETVPLAEYVKQVN